MNIFYLDNDPELAAKYHNDRHVCKMLVEYAQLMSTAHRLCNGSEQVYRATHKNHPSAIWVREGKDNYEWLYLLWLFLSDEYAKRYGKIHLSWLKLSDILSSIPELPSGSTKLRLAMPEGYQSVDPVESYRMYYINDKRHIATWKTEQPNWWR